MVVAALWLLCVSLQVGLLWATGDIGGVNFGDFSLQPNCRKAGNMRHVRDDKGHELLYLFGGKGFNVDLCDANGSKGGKGGKGAKKCEPFYMEGELKSAKRKTLLFGDTWAFDLYRGGWDLIEPPAADLAEPQARWKHESVYIWDRKGLVMFGGCTTTESSGVLNDIWVLSFHNHATGVWRQVQHPPGVVPAPRRGHVVSSNYTHLIIFGGKTWSGDLLTGSAAVLKDLWVLPLGALLLNASLEDFAWTRLSDLPDKARWGATGTVIPAKDGSNVLAVFGGRNKKAWAAEHTTDPDAYTYYNALWMYDFNTDTWSLANATGPRPVPRDHHGMAKINDDLFIYAGRVKEDPTADAIVGDIWSYSTKTEQWLEHSAASDPVENSPWLRPHNRYMPAVAEIKWRGKHGIVIFGGEMLPGSTKTTCMNDLWVFVPEQGAGWQRLHESNCVNSPHDLKVAANGQQLYDSEEAEDARQYDANASMEEQEAERLDGAVDDEEEEEEESEDEVRGDETAAVATVTPLLQACFACALLAGLTVAVAMRRRVQRGLGGDGYGLLA